MAEINLLRRYPQAKRNIAARSSAKSEDHIRIAREYGQMYFDGPREYGYGGFKYDGRWTPIAEDIIDHFKLKPGMRVLDVGCAKGFLVKDLMKVCPGLEAFGLDISEYAVMNCEPEVIGRLHVGTAEKLPFPDHSFDAVIAINVLHNLPQDLCIKAIEEVERISPGRAYIQVDSYRTPEEKELFLDWVLTAEYHDYPEKWKTLFEKAGYTGDYYWTFVS